MVLNMILLKDKLKPLLQVNMKFKVCSPLQIKEEKHLVLEEKVHHSLVSWAILKQVVIHLVQEVMRNQVN